MARKLDAARIERARRKEKRENTKEIERQRMHETMEENRKGSRKGRMRMPAGAKARELEKPKKLRVAAYCRVSTLEEKQMGSFEMQVKHFTDLITSNPEYELVDIYKDEGISGTLMEKRKDFMRMLDDAKAGKIDLIYAKSISRFGRNIVEVLSTLDMLGSLNPPVAVTFDSQGISTANGGNKLIISILSALAELESQQRSIAVKEGIRYRMREGLYKFSVKFTIGYTRDYTGKVIIEPAGAEVVQYIYDSFLEGSSIQDIADALTEQGISTPRGKSKWSYATIRSILTNEKYCGDILYQKTYSESYITHKSVKNTELPQWEWENVHPAIITRKRWQRVQEIIASGVSRSKKPPAMTKRMSIVRVKAGALSGFYLIDPDWDKEEREKFLSIIDAINNDTLEPNTIA